MFRKLLIGWANISKRKNIFFNFLQRPLVPIYQINLKFYVDDAKDRTIARSDDDRKLKIIKTEVSWAWNAIEIFLLHVRHFYLQLEQLIHLSSDGYDVPEIDDISAEEWNEMIHMSNAKRLHHYSILFRKHITCKNDKVSSRHSQ